MDPPDIIKIELSGQVSRLSVGVNLPFKKTAVTIPLKKDQSTEPMTAVKYSRNDALNSQIRKAMAVAEKVSKKTNSIQNEVVAYQRDIFKQSLKLTPN